MIYGPDGKTIIAGEVPADGPMVKITRSFSFKKNLGNYQSCDFFTSQTAECRADKASEFSQGLYEWCEEQTMMNVRDVERRLEAKKRKAEKKSWDKQAMDLQRAEEESMAHDLAMEGYLK